MQKELNDRHAAQELRAMIEANVDLGPRVRALLNEMAPADVVVVLRKEAKRRG
jgi:hypothetical protein